MKPKINSISIATRDLQRSFRFYREGMGLYSHGIRSGGRHHASFRLGNNLDLVIYCRDGEIASHADPAPSNGLLISHYAGSKEEVDIILQKALDAGAVSIGTAHNEPWLYAVQFADPDGYLWEIAWEA